MKKNFIKRILSITVILALLLTSLASCNRAFDEEEVISAAKELLKSAEKLNYIYYGDGIKYYDNSEAAISIYREAQKSHLDELGFHTVEELKAMTEETFTAGYSQIMYSSVLDTLRVDDTIVGYKRYYDQENEDGTITLMVNMQYESLLKSTIVYDYDSITVKKSIKERVYLSVNAVVINAEGDSRSVEITINLVEEEDGWRIDNPVWANY